MEDADINALIDQARRGDAESWAVLFERCQKHLLGDAQQLLGRDWPNLSPRDLTQDTWLSAQANLDRFRGPGFLAWLSAIMRNRYLNLVRGKTRPVPAATDSIPEPTADETSALRAILDRERIEVLSRAVAALDAQQRELLRLRMDDLLSFVEIGVRLGLSERVARTRFHDVIRILQHRLQELRE